MLSFASALLACVLVAGTPSGDTVRKSARIPCAVTAPAVRGSLVGTIDAGTGKAILAYAMRNSGPSRLALALATPSRESAPTRIALAAGDTSTLPTAPEVRLTTTSKSGRYLEFKPQLVAVESTGARPLLLRVDTVDMAIVLPAGARKVVKSNVVMARAEAEGGRVRYRIAAKDWYPTTVRVWFTNAPEDVEIVKTISVARETVTVNLRVANKGSASASGLKLSDNFSGLDWAFLPTGSAGKFVMTEPHGPDPWFTWNGRVSVPSGGERTLSYRLLKRNVAVPARLHETRAVNAAGDLVAVSNIAFQ